MIKLVDFLKEGSEQIYTIEIIAKNGKKTTSKVPASSPVELNGIVSALKKSKNAASVKVLKVEGSISENEDGPGSSDYVYKKDSGGGRPTMILKLGPQSWEKVKHLFDDQGRPKEELSKIKAGGYTWDLYAQSYKQGDNVMHKIYGVAGDSTFGNAPLFYQQKYRGNIKIAKYIFDWFIKNYLQNSISENEDGPGSSKLSHMSLGMKTTRVVISGPDVVTNQEKILKLGQEMDPNFDAKFFPATGKIVGSMSQVKVQPLNLKLRDRKWKAEAEAKAQAQSLKKEGESSNSVKLVTDPQIIDKLLSNRRISNNCTYVIQGEYDNIVCFAYKGDEDERLDALTEYIKQHPSENEYEFVEYVNGEERTFTM